MTEESIVQIEPRKEVSQTCELAMRIFNKVLVEYDMDRVRRELSNRHDIFEAPPQEQQQ
jgi:hypothetical protein